METIGERIRYLRKDVLGKTQKDFGNYIGLKPNSISDIESGKNVPTEQTLKAICREFNVNEEWLRYGKGSMKKNINNKFAEICFQIGVSDEKAKKAIIDYWNLSKDDKELFWKFIEKFMK